MPIWREDKELSKYSRCKAKMDLTKIGQVASVLAVEGVVPVSARVCDFDPRKTCLAELGRARKESECRGLSG